VHACSTQPAHTVHKHLIDTSLPSNVLTYLASLLPLPGTEQPPVLGGITWLEAYQLQHMHYQVGSMTRYNACTMQFARVEEAECAVHAVCAE